MAIRNNNFGIFSATGGGGGSSACVTSIGISVCQGSGLILTFTSNPITNTGTFSLSNSCPYFGESVHVLGSGTCSTIRCQVNNTASSQYSASLGGCSNSVNSSYSSIVGGCQNCIKTNTHSFIGGGISNTLCASNSVILGGCNNNIFCISTFDYSFNTIGGGDCNIMCSSPTISTTPYSFIGGGKCNLQSTNGALDRGGVILGGLCNTNITNQTIGGGVKNTSFGGIESTILGGSNNSLSSGCSTILGGFCNFSLANLSFISGSNNCICSSGILSTILGGFQNITNECDVTIGGGCSNTIICRNSAIGGGEYNKINGISSFIGGGLGNFICETTSGISDGSLNTIGNSNLYSVSSISSTLINVIGDVSSQFSVNDIIYYLDESNNKIYNSSITSVSYNSISGYTELGGVFVGTIVSYIRNLTKTTSNTSCYSLILSGYGNTNSSDYNLTINGKANSINSKYSNLLNGNSNCICSSNSCFNQIDNGNINQITCNNSCFNTISNGCSNQINNNCCSQFGLIANGSYNRISSNGGGYQLILGGLCNYSNGLSTFIANGNYNFICDNSNNPTSNITSVVVGGVGQNTYGGVWDEVNFNFSTLPTIASTQGKYSFLGGGFQNINKKSYSNIVGGKYNCVYNQNSFIGGGLSNCIDASGEVDLCYSTILGGNTNVITNLSNFSFIGGGLLNNVQGNNSIILGGESNTINYDLDSYGFIGGGLQNIVGGQCSCGVIFGGYSNTISGYGSTIYGGQSGNIVSNYSNIIGGTSNSINSLCNSTIVGSNNIISDINSNILGKNITTNAICTSFVNSLSIMNTPNVCQSGLTLGRNSITGQVVTVLTSSFQSIGLCVPQGLCVYSTNPLTTTGSLCVCGGGLSSQYIRGDGTLASFPNISGGGGKVFYFNGGTNQGTFGGNTYYQLSTNASTSTQVTFPISGNGTLASFITDSSQPNLTYVPSGIWNILAYFNSSANDSQVTANLYVYNGSTFTQIGTGVAETITDSSTIDLYTLSISVSATNISSTDRLAIEFVASSNASKTITLYTQDNTISSVTTTLPQGLGSLNGLINSSQTFATKNNLTNFTITSANGVHCFSLPTSSSINRGALSSSDFVCFNTCAINCCLPSYSTPVNCNSTFGSFTNLCYFESGELTNSCTITWGVNAGGCAPSGLSTSTYRYIRYGNYVSFQFQACYSTQGQCINVFCIATPSTIPIASSITNVTASFQPLFWGNGGFFCNSNCIASLPGGTQYSGKVAIRCVVDAPSNNRGIIVQQQGFNCNVRGVWGTINYITT